MRKSSKLIVVAGTIAALAVPSAAMADAPDGEVLVKKAAQSENASGIGWQSSAIKQNGQFVAGNHDLENAPDWMDQTTYPGSRSELVQASHALDSIGRDK